MSHTYFYTLESASRRDTELPRAGHLLWEREVPGFWVASAARLLTRTGHLVGSSALRCLTVSSLLFSPGLSDVHPLHGKPAFLSPSLSSPDPPFKCV